MPKTNRHQVLVNFRIPPAALERLKRVSRRRGVAQSHIVRLGIDQVCAQLEAGKSLDLPFGIDDDEDDDKGEEEER